jgi:hypothetical protein
MSASPRVGQSVTAHSTASIGVETDSNMSSKKSRNALFSAVVTEGARTKSITSALGQLRRGWNATPVEGEGISVVAKYGSSLSKASFAS